MTREPLDAMGRKPSQQGRSRVGLLILGSAVVLLFLLFKGGVRQGGASNGAVFDDDPEIIRWARQNGGVVRLKVGKACDTCVRGAVASEDIPAGGLIAKIPLNISINFKSANMQSHAYNMIKRLHLEKDFNKTHGPYIRNWAPPEEILGPELYTEEQIQMLQSPVLEGIIRHRQQLAQQWYTGQAGQPPLNFPIAPAVASLDSYKWLISLMSSRMFDLRVRGISGQYLLPVMDMLKHSDPETANAHWLWDDEFVYAQSRKELKAGDELGWSYQGTVIHRNDMSLFLYGFVQDKSPQLLCSQDRAGFNATEPFLPTPPNDDLGNASPEAVQREVARLQGVLQSLPTTLEEDQALLAKAEKAGEHWRTVTILRYRVMRKQAIIERIALLRGTLEGGAGAVQAQQVAAAGGQ